MANTDLVTLSNPTSSAAEAFRTLRTNLMFISPTKALHTLVMTATAEADDKSIALANLAVTFAQAGNKTILVDSDMRRPTQHEIWGVDNSRGLTTMMIEDSSLANPPLLTTSVENLRLLPSGPKPAVPADILSSHRMSEIIGLLKARADYVLFDAPPVLAATDAVLLGHKVDGILLVIRSGHTRRDHALQARQALERVHVPLIGTVLTNAPRERMRQYS